MKTKICALLLAFSMAFSVIPATNVSASALETEAVNESTVDEDNNQADNFEEITEILEPGYDTTESKVYGSNGKAYEGVEYLSAGIINSLPLDAQEVYVEMCDHIASMHESGIEVKDITFTANDEMISIEYIVPTRLLTEQMVEISSNVEEEINLLNQGEALEDSTAQYDTLMDNKGYFRNQLDTYEDIIYVAGENSIVKKGSNKITAVFKGRHIADENEPLNAISALINTYPNKFNWMDLSPKGGLTAQGAYYYASRVSVWTFTLKKSKFYASSLEKSADKKVKALVEEAYKYAESNYPDSPTYGIVKYFNDWICENNYYEAAGTDEKNYGNTVKYFYCHSVYGVLLKGYGVCESYALTMTRLLDAAGIRNMYILGDAEGGHAWNHVQMPDGKWYMVDSTWNDSDDRDNWDNYLLVKNDGKHNPTGMRFTVGDKFRYDSLAVDDYEEAKYEDFYINYPEVIFKPKRKWQLYTIGARDYNYYEKYNKVWSSSNENVVKVNKNGNLISQKTTGSAQITCKMAGKEVSCTVYVYDFTGLKFEENNKSSYTLNYANPDDTFSETDDEQLVTLRVEQQNYNLSASYIAEKRQVDEPTAKSNNPSIVQVKNVELCEDQILLSVVPQSYGTAKITVKFGGKKAVLTVKVTRELEEEWFDFSKVVDAKYNKKAIKPQVVLSTEGELVRPKVKFKVTYENNKNVGTATVKVTGTGKYGGIIEKMFEITY